MTRRHPPFPEVVLSLCLLHAFAGADEGVLAARAEPGQAPGEVRAAR